MCLDIINEIKIRGQKRKGQGRLLPSIQAVDRVFPALGRTANLGLQHEDMCCQILGTR